MLDVISRWNRWGSAILSGGYPRRLTDSIYPFVNTKDIAVLIGLRRSGKTTILFQLMDYLENQSIPKEAMLHVNFEEPSLAPNLTLETLDLIYNTYRKHIFPKGKAFLFFDEIQHVPQWERWVRARNESENIKLFLTGSSAHMMSRELGTVLTGRHASFVVYPLSFSEYLQFQHINISKKKLPINAPHEIAHALERYLKWGALPEIVLSESDERRELLLKQYFDDLLFKDVAMRHEVRDIVLLRNLAVYLLTQTASLVSYHRIANQFEISLDKARSYCAFLEEAFLVDFLPFFSLKTAERNRHPFKVHAVDLGLRNVVSITGSPDRGRLIESAVYHQLKIKHQQSFYYWRGEQEIDIARRAGNEIVEIVQVSLHCDDLKTRERENNALLEAKQRFKKATTQLIVDAVSKNNAEKAVLLWSFLLR